MPVSSLTIQFLLLLPHKSDLKALTAAMLSLDGGSVLSFEPSLGAALGCSRTITKEVSVFNFEFLKLRIQRPSSVIVLWFC